MVLPVDPGVVAVVGTACRGEDGDELVRKIICTFDEHHFEIGVGISQSPSNDTACVKY